MNSAAIMEFRLSGGRVWFFNRIRDTTAVGMILTDGVRQPSIFPGVDTDSGWVQQIKSNYLLK